MRQLDRGACQGRRDQAGPLGNPLSRVDEQTVTAGAHDISVCSLECELRSFDQPGTTCIVAVGSAYLAFILTQDTQHAGADLFDILKSGQPCVLLIQIALPGTYIQRLVDLSISSSFLIGHDYCSLDWGDICAKKYRGKF